MARIASNPANLFEDAGIRFPAEIRHSKEEQVDAAAAWIVVLVAGELAAHRGAYAQLLPEFANQRLLAETSSGGRFLITMGI